MSQQDLSKATVVTHSEKQHPERMYILGGSWLAMVSLGMVGMSAIVNPDVKFPIIDPLLEKLAPQIVATTEQTADFSTSSIRGTATPSALSQTSTEIPEIQPEPAVIEAAQPSESTAPDLIPQPSATSAMPTWFYVGIIASCIAGSSLITYFLYKVTQQPTQPKKSPQKSQKVRATVKTTEKQRNQSVQAIQKNDQSQSVKQVKSPVAQRKIEVAGVAPLRISTPTDVKPPQVKLEPVIDPQPTQVGPSKAEKLGEIAEKAKETSPKSLVEMMDIRRRGSLAPLLQDL